MLNKFYKHLMFTSFAALLIGQQAVANPDDDPQSTPSAPIASSTDILPNDIIKYTAELLIQSGDTKSAIALSRTSKKMHETLEEQSYHAQCVEIKKYNTIILDALNQLNVEYLRFTKPITLPAVLFETFAPFSLEEKKGNGSWKDLYNLINIDPGKVFYGDSQEFLIDVNKSIDEVIRFLSNSSDNTDTSISNPLSNIFSNVVGFFWGNSPSDIKEKESLSPQKTISPKEKMILNRRIVAQSIILSLMDGRGELDPAHNTSKFQGPSVIRIPDLLLNAAPEDRLYFLEEMANLKYRKDEDIINAVNKRKQK